MADMGDSYNPIQLIPCEPGWTAHYWDTDRQTLRVSAGDAVTMWALCQFTTPAVEPDLARSPQVRKIVHGNVVCGVVRRGTEGMVICEEDGDFAGYKPPSLSLEDLIKEVQAGRTLKPPNP